MKYPLWLNIIAGFGLFLLPIGVVLGMTIPTPIGIFICLIGFILVMYAGEKAEQIDRIKGNIE